MGKCGGCLGLGGQEADDQATAQSAEEGGEEALSDRVRREEAPSTWLSWTM